MQKKKIPGKYIGGDYFRSTVSRKGIMKVRNVIFVTKIVYQNQAKIQFRKCL